MVSIMYRFYSKPGGLSTLHIVRAYQDFLFDSTASLNYYAVHMKHADDDGWQYGDIWKQGSPDAADTGPEVEYVELLRGDLGTGFDDSYLLDLVSYLGSMGIRATYDSYSVGLEFGLGAMKTYVLKVESGKEQEAREFLRNKG
jgi:hypothetical protein